jgi:hypothetical protein
VRRARAAPQYLVSKADPTQMWCLGGIGRTNPQRIRRSDGVILPYERK